MMWPPEKVKKSERALAEMGGDDAPHNNDSCLFRQQIRGGRTCQFFNSDPRAVELEYALLMNSGIQMYLNKCIAADAAVAKYTDQLLFNSRCGNHGSVGRLAELRADSIQRNLELLSGREGLNAISSYCKYFSYKADVWGNWRMLEAGKQRAALDIICVIQDLAYRLVYVLDQPKYELLQVAYVPEAGEGVYFDVDRVRQVATRLEAKREACSASVDVAFTAIWTHRLLHLGLGACRAAQHAICDMLASMRPTSIAVEKKHLLGQEAKPAKRGSAVSCDRLGI